MTTDPVLVVGAGPVGLVAAAELARRHIPVRIVDKLAAPTTESRAIIVHARSLEMFDRIGIVDEIIEAGVRTTAMEMHADGHPVARLDLDTVDSAFPFSVTLAQTETERILTEFLGKQEVSVERGAALTDLEQDQDAVRATVGGSVVTTPYLIGADGSHSDVRRLVGTALAGSFKGERFLMGDVETVHDLDPHSMYSYFSKKAGPLMVFPMRGNRMRLIAQIDGAQIDGADREPTIEWLQEIVDDRAGTLRIESSHWLTVFEIHHAQVPAYRSGRVFLAGDAAHVHSPAGGQGMNTGMQDAFNLGWKIARATTGTPAETLLDSYHAERHPVAAKVIEFSTKLTDMATLDSAFARELRNHVMHAVVGLTPVRLAMANETEETALSYRGSPLLVDGRHHRHLVRAGDHLPDVPDLRRSLAGETGHVLVTVAPSGAPAADADGFRQVLIASHDGAVDGYDLVIADPEHVARERFGLRHGGRVMLRPDGYVGFVADLDDPAAAPSYAHLVG